MVKEELPRVSVEYKDLPKYYGTVWIAYKFVNKGCRYVIDSHYKNIKNRKDDGYTIKKKVFVPYKEWNKQFEEPKETEEEREERKRRIGEVSLF